MHWVRSETAFLSKAGIRTDRAGLGAVIALVKAADQRLIDVALHLGVAGHHLLSMHFELLC